MTLRQMIAPLARWLPAPLARSLIALWAAWFAILFVFQGLVTQRLDLRRPDFAVVWAPPETVEGAQSNKPYLLDPFMNNQVSWDSEYYISIALAGYNDPQARLLPTNAPVRPPLNYAFFPLYPLLMSLFIFPLRLLSMSPIATATLAGVIVSLLGTLAGMFALWDLTHDSLGDDGAWRAVFYLLVFPTGFFLAMVYTEGLFIGIAFTALALSRRGQWVWASALAALAPWTRAHGVILVLPLAVALLQSCDWKRGWWEQITPRLLIQGALVFAPLVSYLIWRTGPLGQGWALVQTSFFSRGLFEWDRSMLAWSQALRYAGSNPQASIYYNIELLSLALAAVAAIFILPQYPGIALFSLGVVVLSALSGVPQSMSRYVLIAPATYIFLSKLGRSRAFDRAWTTASVLLMGMSAMLFAFDMWVG